MLRDRKKFVCGELKELKRTGEKFWKVFDAFMESAREGENFCVITRREKREKCWGEREIEKLENVNKEKKLKSFSIATIGFHEFCMILLNLFGYTIKFVHCHWFYNSIKFRWFHKIYVAMSLYGSLQFRSLKH